MRRILTYLGIIMLSVALSGCIWGGPWGRGHGGHDGGGYHRHY
ncbi:hypothetical protein EZJ58_4352 [Sodalis ligni]|uniref:Lipoprotein n=1 Tax=Sodalis ligni TaxID=2697027 RepID=A0A4R1NP39_9GAMM|nr:hypothetical protein EZJ58_4352 [Sodalis ligni]